MPQDIKTKTKTVIIKTEIQDNNQDGENTVSRLS